MRKSKVPNGTKKHNTGSHSNEVIIQSLPLQGIPKKTCINICDDEAPIQFGHIAL